MIRTLMEWSAFGFRPPLRRDHAGAPVPASSSKAPSFAFGEAIAPVLADLGLTASQYLVLALLWERDGSTSAHLMGHLRADGTTVDGWLLELAEAGLIEVDRSAEPPDVWLSDQGRRLQKQAPVVPSALLIQAFRWAGDPARAPRA